MSRLLLIKEAYCGTKTTSFNKTLSYLIKTALLLFIFLGNLSAFGQTNYYSTATGSGIWSDETSWNPVGIPGTNDNVFINRNHNITVTADVACASVTFRITNNNSHTWGLTVNSGATLNVSGNITMQYHDKNHAVVANISGQGTITAGSIVLGNNITSFSNGQICTLNSSISSMNITEDIVIYSYYSDNSNYRRGVFAHNQGTIIVVNGSIVTQNQPSATSTFKLGASSPNLILKGVTSFVLSGAGTNTITLNTNNSTVEYQRAGDQYVYGPTNYYNLISSGSGTKTLKGNIGVTNLTISGASNLATEYPIIGNSEGSLVMNNTATLSLGSASSTVSFPSNFTPTNITLNPNTTVVYKSGGDQTVSSAPSSYKKLRIEGSGIKTVDGNIRVDESLVLDNARLSTGTGADIILGKDATISASVPFSSSQMIVTIGTGSLVKEGTQPSDFEMVYPIGADTAYYTPLEVTSLSATVNGTGSFYARTLNERAPFTNDNDLNRYWATNSNNLSNITASMKFRYDANDVLGVEAEYEAKFLSGEIWTPANNGMVNTTSDFFTTENAVNINGLWTLREPTKTYYSYQSGSWDKPQTWTTDPSGSVWEGGGVPTAHDRVVILNGRTINILNDTKVAFSLQINEGGMLDIGTTIGHNFNTVVGKGTIRLASTTFPAGDISGFVAAGGGTVEYYNSNSFIFDRKIYNNLIINLPNNLSTATINDGMEMNGSLTIKRGVFLIDAAGDKTLSIKENLTVEGAGKIEVGNTNGVRKLIISGDFVNYGLVKFSKLSEPKYLEDNDNHVEVYFDNASKDQYVKCYGRTEFYRLVVNKGTDQTYILNIDASNVSNFKLFGQNYKAASYQSPFAPPNVRNNKALDIWAGTLRLGNNIDIPSLTNHYPQSGAYPHYYIDEDAMLWLDGATVKLSDTENYVHNTAFLLYGGYKQTGNSKFTDNGPMGTVMRDEAQIFIEGGEYSTEIIRTSNLGANHRGSFTMLGGELTLRGAISSTTQYGVFSLPYVNNSINISGGTINILAPNSASSGVGQDLSILIGADPNNINITGGTVNLYVTDKSNSYISSTMPFWDLNIIKSSTNSYSAQPKGYPGYSAHQISEIPAQPLIVLNNLTLLNKAILTSGPSNVNVIVGGDFTINNEATYTPGTNNTIFNGSGVQTFSNSGTITDGLNNISIINGSELNLAGAKLDFVVRGIFEIGTESALRDNTKIVKVLGNIINSGTHIRPSGAAGRILLTGSANQVISGDGNGKFNNLAVDKTGGTLTVSSDIRINGAFCLLKNIRVDLGSNRLTLGEYAAVYSELGTGNQFSNNKMILTNGLGSDGGIAKIFRGSGSETILLPYGFYKSSNSTHYYLPSTIEYCGTVGGTITSRPVSEHHPLAQNDSVLGAYWKNTATGFEGVETNSFNLNFIYNDDLITGTDTNYVAGVYRNDTSWIYLNDPTAINPPTKTITFANQQTAMGDHTAGYTSAFAAIPVLYSRQSGDWDSTSTWSITGHDGDPASQTPNQTTLVAIGGGHIVQINSDNKQAGGLRLIAGSTLDLTNTQGHDFSSIPEETINGAGTLKISSSNYFPAGDFGDFIGPDGGTVEYYTDEVDIVLPIESADVAKLKLNQYRNLVLRIGTDKRIQLPSIEKLTILENLLCTGNKNETGAIEILGDRKLEVKGNFTIDKPTFVVNGDNNDISIYGDLMLTSDTARFTVFSMSETTSNRLNIYGNIVNSGTFELKAGTYGKMEAIFRGTKNTEISGGGTYNFYKIIVDKGINRDAIVNLLSSVQIAANPLLELRNGTFRVNHTDADIVITNRNTNFTIPNTAALSVLDGSVKIASSTGAGSGKLFLVGRLEVLGGKMFIGDNSSDNNHSIEYAPAGDPEIIVEGGELNVRGQIRRLTTVTTGNLHYRQSGGTTTIYGKGRESSRALFEIDNLGVFEMSGGTLQFDCPSAQGNTTFGDVIIRPNTLSVTGGTIKFGLSTSSQNYDFKMIASSPLWNLTVGDEVRPQSLTTTVFPVTVGGELLVNQGSIFKANGFDVTLKGNFVNKNASAAIGVNDGGYQPGTTTQTTIFSGSTQTITGAGNNLTNFANLLIEPTSLVSLLENTTLKVNYDLEIRRGTLNDGGNFVNVAGDIINTSKHASNFPTGGLRLVGMKNQKLRGYGATYGNIIIDNSKGISLLDNTAINGKLVFENGLIYIDDYLLTLGISSTVEGVFDNHKMIMLNGVLSDLGVKKKFPTGVSEFTIPIGIDGKYTPATYKITANTRQGDITVRPVNRAHPALHDSIDNELQYYWSVEAKNFDANLKLTHKYQYIEGDVKGDIDQYDVGLYHYKTYTWDNLGRIGNPGIINKIEKTINVIDVNYATGDFTAGYSDNFISLDTYYSRDNRYDNEWENPQNWSTVGHDDDTHPATTAPRGNPIVIAEGHIMKIFTDGQKQASVEINGTLDCGKTVFHNLGNVYGKGKIVIESTDEGIFVFPAGEFDQFFNTLGTEVELTGSENATMPLKPGNYSKPYNNLILSGTGIKNMSAEDLRVKGRLEIRDGTVLNSSRHNKSIYISGDWINENIAENSFIAGTGTVYIEGGEAQNMDVSAIEKFNNLTMMNTKGLYLTDTAIEVMRILRLTRGVIHSAEGREVILSNASSNAAVGANTLSFVDGPVKKLMVRGGSFRFPTGNLERYGYIELTRVTSLEPSAYWTAQYYNTNPNPTYPTEKDNLAVPLTELSNNEYWSLIRPDISATTNIRLRYDGMSFPALTGSTAGRNLLRVVEYVETPQKWYAVGGGSAASGSVNTATPIEQNGNIYSIGVIGITATIEDVTPREICDNNTDYVTVPVKLTGTPPYKLLYQTVGEHTRNFVVENIMSSQYLITLNGFSMGGYSETPYTLKLVAVYGAGDREGLATSNQVQITVKLTHKPNISGAEIVATNEERTYSTPFHTGSSYFWEWVGTEGGTIKQPTQSTTAIEFDSVPGEYILRVTETSSSGCFFNDDITINTQNKPAPYMSPRDMNICQGETQDYSTNYNPSNQYLWTIIGGTATCPGCGTWSNSPSVTVTWDNPIASGRIKVEERVGTSDVKSEDILQIQVSKEITENVLEGDDVCYNEAGQITVKGSELGVAYQLVNYNSGGDVGSHLSGNGGDLHLITNPLTETGMFRVRAFNNGCELLMPETGTVDVAVLKPEFNIAIDDVDTIVCPGAEVVFTASETTSLSATYEFYLNNLPVVSSTSTSYITSSLQHNDKIYVKGSTIIKGCVNYSDTITVSVGEYMWSGEVSDTWGTTNNWSCKTLPTIASNVLIPKRANYMPTVSTAASVRTIEIEKGASLTHSGGIFSIAGDIINSGTFTSSNATIRLTGGNEQNLIDNNLGFNFSNLTVDKQGNSVNLGAKVNISGVLTLTKGVVKTTDTNILTLRNTASATSGNADSYVDGPMQKIGNTDFTFPVGAGDRWARIGIFGIEGAKSTITMKAQYKIGKYSEPDNVNAPLNNASKVEHWALQNTTNDAKCNVELFTESVSISNINLSNLSDLRVAYFNEKWIDKGNGGTSFVTNSGSIRSAYKTKPNSYFTFGSLTGDNPLPVELVNFKAYLHNEQTILTWLTATEYNNSHFEIERSDDMRDFIKIGAVYSKAQNGNCAQAIDYSFTDDAPKAGTNYYRLKQVDFNGLYSYSKVVSVTSERESDPLESVIVYPNPTTGIVNIVVPQDDENILISLYSCTGALLIGYNYNSAVTTIDLGKYSSGLYLLKISNNGKHVIQKVIKQ